MTRSIPRSFLFAAGLLAGLAGAWLFGLGNSGPRAFAQPPAVPTGARYWLSTWNTNTNAGAYVMDTQTGELWYVISSNEPEALGRPARKAR